MSLRKLTVTCVLVGAFALLPVLSAPAVAASRPTLSPVSAPAAPPLRRGLEDLFLLGTVVGLIVKDAGTVAAKYKTRASAAQPDYAAGVAAGAAHFEQNAIAAEDRYKAGVTDAAARGAYGKGLRGSGAKYQKNATTLGPSRFAQGVANAQDAYAAGMQPVLTALSAITLPPRQVKGMNQERANIVATRLRALKTGKAA